MQQMYQMYYVDRNVLDVLCGHNNVLNVLCGQKMYQMYYVDTKMYQMYYVDTIMYQRKGRKIVIIISFSKTLKTNKESNKNYSKL